MLKDFLPLIITAGLMQVRFILNLLLTFILWCLDTVFVRLILHRQLNEVVISALTEHRDVSAPKSVTKQLI